MRTTAYEKELEIKQDILSHAENMWEKARSLQDNFKFKDRFEDNVLTQSGRLSFHGKESELLLATTDENGNYSGNVVIPVNPYRGQIKFDEMRLDVTEDARFVILNQGDIDNSAKILTLNTLSEAQEFKDTEKTIIIALDDKDKDMTLSDLVDDSEKIAEKLNTDDLKEVEEITKEIVREEEKELVAAEMLEHSEEKETTSPRGRDENNILRHAPEEEHTPKVKELV